MPMFFQNIFLILGTVIGAGIFSLPFVLQRSGIVVFVTVLAVVAVVMVRVNIYVYEIVTHTRAKHQIPGYISLILGPGWGRVSLYMMMFATGGSLVAFAFLGGTFIAQLLPVSEQLGTMLFYTFATAVILIAGTKLEAVDMIFTAIKMSLLVVIVLAMALVLPFETARVPFTSIDPLSVLGAIVFAFTGFSTSAVLHRSALTKQSIYAAQVIIFVTYLLFSLAAYFFIDFTGFSLPNRQLDLLFNLAGVFVVLTPYLVISMIGRETLLKDVRLNERTAIGLMAFVPFFFILFRVGSFLEVLSFTGGVFIATVGIMICQAYAKVFPQKRTFEVLFIQLIFLACIMLEIFSLFY
jgi:amino acid permease